MFTKQIAVATAGLLLAFSAQADVAVTADVGTTGVGVHLVVPMEKTLNGRFGANAFNYSKGERAGSINYDTKTKLRSFDVLFDWYLFSQPQLHATAGIIYNGSKVNAIARPEADGKYLINGRPYTAADVATLSGSVEYHKAAPYLGIGWGNPLTSAKTWSFTGDLGVMYQGKSRSRLASIGCTTSILVCSVLSRDVGAEKPRFQDELKSYSAFPVLRVGLAYRF